jgi:hypothetical protein
MPDFTLYTFRSLLLALKERQYIFQPFSKYLTNPARRVIILRHDVDARRRNALDTARIEAKLGIQGTYYFRMVRHTYDPEVIREIASMGQEIGYHYEDVVVAARILKGRGTRDKGQVGTGDKGQGTSGRLEDGEKGRGGEEYLYERALALFIKNLETLRSIAPVSTICMHGSPLSKYDNRRLWEYYNYRDYNIIGEPYFDLDFSSILYLTDTGRRWDGEKVSIRDKIQVGTWDQGSGTSRDFGSRERGKKEEGERGGERFHSTFDIINAARVGRLPDRMMITVHPQRWTDRPIPWVIELVGQRVKNVVKRMLILKENSIRI